MTVLKCFDLTVYRSVAVVVSVSGLGLVVVLESPSRGVLGIGFGVVGPANSAGEFVNLFVLFDGAIEVRTLASLPDGNAPAVVGVGGGGGGGGN